MAETAQKIDRRDYQIKYRTPNMMDPSRDRVFICPLCGYQDTVTVAELKFDPNAIKKCLRQLVRHETVHYLEAVKELSKANQGGKILQVEEYLPSHPCAPDSLDDK